MAVPHNPIFISFGKISKRRNRLTMKALIAANVIRVDVQPDLLVVALAKFTGITRS